MSLTDLELKVNMTNKGLNVFIKCEALEVYFAHFGSSPNSIDGKKLYNWDQKKANDKIYKLFSGDVRYIYNDYGVNLNLVRSKGTKKGVSFKFNQPMSERALRFYFNSLKEELSYLFKTQIKPFLKIHSSFEDIYFCQRCKQKTYVRLDKNILKFIDTKYCQLCYEKIMSKYELEKKKEKRIVA